MSDHITLEQLQGLLEDAVNNPPDAKGVFYILETYWQITGRTIPDFHEALEWADVEKGEMLDAFHSMSEKWVRHNPQKHPPTTLEHVAEEFGDWIMMIYMACRIYEIDPMDALFRKLYVKCEKMLSQD